MEWKEWSCCSFKERRNLPSISGIYVVVDCNDNVWYVGQAGNLNSRWMGRGHHRNAQLSRSNGKRNFNIFWLPCAPGELNQMEQYYINLLHPSLNKTKVKKYSLGKPQLKLEIRQGSDNTKYVYFRGKSECYQEIAEYVGVFPCVPDDELHVSIEKSQLVSRGHALVIALKYEIGGKSKTTRLLCSSHKFTNASSALEGKPYRGGKIVSVRLPQRYYYY